MNGKAEPEVKHVPPIEKQPPAMFTPPVPWNVVVPDVTFNIPPIDSCDPGVDDPIPR